ncbi:unnamed protein product [Sphenostylis stenocarpa]|uniref:Uncharacterized protein n=1 Tax=Sphenostylis stenocarpa TaxID=92480 RepID=A0AA86RW71_9FABA|nr:unnamed protein product [Sphenostylis stenocarpa]
MREKLLQEKRKKESVSETLERKKSDQKKSETLEYAELAVEGRGHLLNKVLYLGWRREDTHHKQIQKPKTISPSTPSTIHSAPLYSWNKCTPGPETPPGPPPHE